MFFKKTDRGHTYSSYFEEDYPRVAIVGSLSELSSEFSGLVTSLNNMPLPLEAGFYAPTSPGLHSPESLDRNFDRFAFNAIAVVLIVGRGTPDPDLDVPDGVSEVELQYIEHFLETAKAKGLTVIVCLWSGDHGSGDLEQGTVRDSFAQIRERLDTELWKFWFNTSRELLDSVVGPLERSMTEARYLYDVAISYTSADAEHAAEIAGLLKAEGIRVFFADDPECYLLGKKLPEELRRIYEGESRYCMVVASKSYLKSEHAVLELESAVERNRRENGDYLLVVKLDDVDLPGVPGTAVYLDRDRVEMIAQIMCSKLGLVGG